MSTRIRSVISLGVVLVLGLAGGMALQSWRLQATAAGPLEMASERRQVFFEHFSRELELDAAQQEQLQELLAQQRDKLRGFQEEFRPRFHQLREETLVTIRALLTPDQQLKFDRLQQRKMGWSRHRGRQRSWGWGGRGGPAGQQNGRNYGDQEPDFKR